MLAALPKVYLADEIPAKNEKNWLSGPGFKTVNEFSGFDWFKIVNLNNFLVTISIG